MQKNKRTIRAIGESVLMSALTHPSPFDIAAENPTLQESSGRDSTSTSHDSVPWLKNLTAYRIIIYPVKYKGKKI